MAKFKINLVNDVAPPIVVTAVNIFAQKSTRTVAGQSMQQICNYALTVGGYLGASMGWGGKYSEMLKNIGIAAAPGALIAIYNKVAKPTTAASIQRYSPMASRVARYPGPAAESPFQGVRLV